MKETKNLPFMPFYPGDWFKNHAARSCPPDIRGLYIDMLCYMWESPEKGVFLNPLGVPYTNEEIVRIVGRDNNNSTAWLETMLECGVVFKRESDGAIFDIATVKREEIRSNRRKDGELGGNPNLLVNQSMGDEVNHGVNHRVNHPTPIEVNHGVNHRVNHPTPIEVNHGVNHRVNPECDIYSLFIKYLNIKVNRGYKGDSKSKRQFQARIREGYSLDDFKLAIDNYVSEKYHIENNFKYLCPEFLTRSDKIERGKNLKPKITIPTPENDPDYERKHYVPKSIPRSQMPKDELFDFADRGEI